MSTADWASAAAEAIVRRARDRFEAHRMKVFRDTDRMFAVLMAGQWVFGILVALLVSPYGWEGKVKVVHAHVWLAVFLGGALSALPIALALLRPGWVVTRHTIAASQMLWSALLIHLTGGRIETHFHVFGSLGILAFYRDWRVLGTATVVVASDHLARGILWPESVYGVVNPEWWRFLEHAFWVIFAVAFLGWACRRSVEDMEAIAEHGAQLEAMAEREWHETSVLDRVAAKAAG
jgi:two-component system, NtrC family, sensor histidine kinase HydH